VKTVTPIGKKEALRLTSAISMLSGAGKTTGANSSQYRELEQLQQDRLKFKKLSRRELQVANYIRDGLSTTKLSKKLNITAGTAKIHRKHIFRKLEIHKSAELISWLNKYFPGNNISANPD
jgi:DNA-binding NarL/FixJ family response regulator